MEIFIYFYIKIINIFIFYIFGFFQIMIFIFYFGIESVTVEKQRGCQISNVTMMRREFMFPFQ